MSAAGVAVSTRVACAAVVLYNDERSEWAPGGHRAWRLRSEVGDAWWRAQLSPAICARIALAFEEGARLIAERALVSLVTDYMARQRAVDAIRPSYTDIRGFLIGELEADPIVACRVAMERTAAANRFAATMGDETVRAGAHRWYL